MGTNNSILKIPTAATSSEVLSNIVLSPNQKKSVQAQLGLFNESLSTSSMVYLLSWVGRTAFHKMTDAEDLEKKLSNQEASAFITLLNCIAGNISSLQHDQLAVVAWSLGKIKVHDHPIVKACENEIISRGVGTFEYRSVSQFLWGFSKLQAETSQCFGEVEKAILRRELNLADFDVRGLAQTLMAFAVTENGSPDMFKVFLEHILSLDFSLFRNFDMAQIAWSFAKREAEANQLFEKIEEEFFRRSVSTITKGVDLAMLVSAFASAKKGSEALFTAIEMEILNLRNLNGFTHRGLSSTIWALGKAGRTRESVFERLESEVKRRGIKTFTPENRQILIEGFGYAGRQLSI